jgi:hypothetical protein
MQPTRLSHLGQMSAHVSAGRRESSISRSTATVDSSPYKIGAPTPTLVSPLSSWTRRPFLLPLMRSPFFLPPGGGEDASPYRERPGHRPPSLPPLPSPLRSPSPAVRSSGRVRCGGGATRGRRRLARPTAAAAALHGRLPLSLFLSLSLSLLFLYHVLSCAAEAAAVSDEVVASSGGCGGLRWWWW